jgi:hypothetical protein
LGLIVDWWSFKVGIEFGEGRGGRYRKWIFSFDLVKIGIWYLVEERFCGFGIFFNGLVFL